MHKALKARAGLGLMAGVAILAVGGLAHAQSATGVPHPALVALPEGLGSDLEALLRAVSRGTQILGVAMGAWLAAQGIGSGSAGLRKAVTGAIKGLALAAITYPAPEAMACVLSAMRSSGYL